MLVGKHGYSHGFLNLLSLFIFGTQGSIDTMVTAAVFPEGSLHVL
jgi:hypothetical protein